MGRRSELDAVLPTATQAREQRRAARRVLQGIDELLRGEEATPALKATTGGSPWGRQPSAPARRRRHSPGTQSCGGWSTSVGNGSDG